MKLKPKTRAAILLICAILCAAPPETRAAELAFSPSAPTNAVFAGKFIRTELYFGMSKPDGGEVSEADWEKFLETEVTTRFPDGLTVLAGYGQYKDRETGKIVGEKSRVLILLYPKKERRASAQKIEQIRAAYVKQFAQQSVFRVDYTKNVEVF